MVTVLLDQVVETDYGQFDLAWVVGAGFDGRWEQVFGGQVNGLVGAAHPDGVYVNLARRSNGSKVTILLGDRPPDPDDTWEEVVEVSTTVPTGATPHWLCWAGMGSGNLPIPAGTYRLRVSERGRDAGIDNEWAEGVVDFYELYFWPSPHRPDEIIRQSSADARACHQFHGGTPIDVDTSDHK